MKKAPEAFRTISEVAEILETPAHVLRFWESKFYQIRPVKRAGGRRYYRPDDVALINGIRNLLQEQGMTIRGVQRVLQEQGAKHVATLGGPLLVADPDEDFDTLDAVAVTESLPVQDDLGSARDDPQDVEDEETAPKAANAPEGDLDDIEFDPAAHKPTLVPEDADEAPVEAPVPDQLIVDDQAGPGAPVPVLVDDPEPQATAAMDTAHEALREADPLPPAVDTLAEPASPLTKPPLIAESDDEERQQTSDRAQLARSLRMMPRGQLGKKRDTYEHLGRRIDALLERMSEASGAGRW